MNTQDFININGKPMYFPGWVDLWDMPGDSQDYNERPIETAEWLFVH